MKQSDNLVLLGTYANAADAYIAKGVLETNDIPAVVNDVNISTIYGGLLPDLDARLYVRAVDYKKAIGLLAIGSNSNTESLQPTPREKAVVKISQIVIGVILAALILIVLLYRARI